MARSSGGLRVKFWGVRGSIPCPGPETSRYGGNTPCIEVLGGSEPVILDAGTGIRELGVQMAASGRPIRAHLLLSHTHWDHIQGFPFFAPIYFPGNEIFVYGPRALEKSLREALLFQLQYAYFPVRGVELQARVEFRELDEEKFHCGDIEVQTSSMNHPIRVLAYRFTRKGKTGVYTGDNEPYYDIMENRVPYTQTGVRRRSQFIRECNDRVADFVKKANVLVADTQYTDKEYDKKRGWGHSSVSDVLELAHKARVKKLVLFHHEPTHTDKDMDRFHRDAVAHARKKKYKFSVQTAREGMEVPL